MGLTQVDGKEGGWSKLAVPGAQAMPLPCRLEEQTRRLQKDMKKSTDADLGRWHIPEPGLA